MNSNLAYQLFQDIFVTTPELKIVEKPAPVCPSALREPKALFGGYGANEGRMFEALQYGKDLRIFQALDNGATYHLHVTLDVVGSMAFTASFLNGRVVSTQEFIISKQYAGRSYRYIGNAEQALLGAYDHMQRLILSGKA